MTPQKQLLLYETATGRCPFEEWFENLKDLKAYNVMEVRLDRLEWYGDTRVTVSPWAGVFSS